MKRKTNALLRWFSKYKWLILLSVAIFPFVLNSIIVQQIWPYWNVAGDANSWIGFWGAYAGAIGTIVMAIIAVEALKVNAEQLEIIKKQNRPYLFCSVSILHQYYPDLKCNKETYILRVENHGIQIAKQVKVKIGISDVSLLSDPLFKNCVEAIEAASFSLSCEGYEDEHETIIMNSVGYLSTTTVQILEAINHSIKELSSHIEGTKNDQT